MDSLISTFHIDLRLIIAQAINFAIVFAVLYFFALKPLTQVMRDRSKKIEKSLEDAKSIEVSMEKTKKDYQDTLIQARREAQMIMEKASEQAEKKKSEMLDKAKEEIGLIINQEKEKMQAEKKETLVEIKKEVADLVAVALEKILEEKIDHKKDKEMINKIIKG